MRKNDSAWEFEALVARSARRGWLDIAELIDSYALLTKTAEPAGRVRIDVAVSALRKLPAELGSVERLLIVPDLGAYPVTPIALGELGRYARLGDDVLLVEATRGMGSLLQLAALLCALQLELQEARTLAGETWLEQLAGRIGAEGGHAAAEEANADAPPFDTQILISELAFRWGTDPATLGESNTSTGGALLPLLLGTSRLPDVDIHADLAPQAAAARAQRIAERIAATLAEMGFLQRPIHLWLGDAIVVECLSPYCRELRPVLTRWHRIANDSAADALEEDDLYGLADAFVNQDQELAQERAEADRTVGILRHESDGVRYDTVDLGRIDAALCDARVQIDAPDAVLLRVNLPAWDTDAVLLRTLLDLFGRGLERITLILEGAVIDAPAGALALPQLLVPWTGRGLVMLPASEPGTAALARAGAGDVRQGALLSVDCAELAQNLHRQNGRYHVAGVVIGATGVVTALHEGLCSGRLRSTTPIDWCMVGSHRMASGAPSRETLAGLAAASCALVSSYVREPDVVSELEPPPPAAPRLNPWAMRIKA